MCRFETFCLTQKKLCFSTNHHRDQVDVDQASGKVGMKANDTSSSRTPRAGRVGCRRTHGWPGTGAVIKGRKQLHIDACAPLTDGGTYCVGLRGLSTAWAQGQMLRGTVEPNGSQHKVNRVQIKIVV